MWACACGVDCVYLDLSTGRWRSSACSETRTFVCKAPSLAVDQSCACIGVADGQGLGAHCAMQGTSKQVAWCYTSSVWWLPFLLRSLSLTKVPVFFRILTQCFYLWPRSIAYQLVKALSTGYCHPRYGQHNSMVYDMHSFRNNFDGRIDQQNDHYCHTRFHCTDNHRLCRECLCFDIHPHRKFHCIHQRCNYRSGHH